MTRPRREIESAFHSFTRFQQTPLEDNEAANFPISLPPFEQSLPYHSIMDNPATAEAQAGKIAEYEIFSGEP